MTAARRFVVIGSRATASPDFLLVDIPGTGGRLDLLLRCVRASLLVSHGLRRDAVTYLVLLGGPLAPRALRIDGSAAKYLRPDERSLATLAKKALATPGGDGVFVDARPGVAVANGGLDAVLADLGPSTVYVLDEGGDDLRDAPLDLERPVFVLGDHGGIHPEARAKLAGAAGLRVGPRSLHADDVVSIVWNELDRRDAAR